VTVVFDALHRDGPYDAVQAGASPPPVRIPTLFTSATSRPPPGLLRGASLANRPSPDRAPRVRGKLPGRLEDGPMRWETAEVWRVAARVARG
jgi:hypothetical protein